MNIHGPGAKANVARPGGRLKLAAGMNPMGIPHEMHEETKLGRTEVNAVAVATHDIGGEIHLEILKRQQRRRLGLVAGAVQRRPDQRNQPFWQKWPGDAVVRPIGKELLLKALITGCQEHQNEEGSCLPFEAQLGAQGRNVHTRKPGFQQQDSGPQVAQPLGQPLPVLFAVNLNADLPEDVDGKRSKGIVLGGQQNGCGGGQWRARVAVRHLVQSYCATRRRPCARGANRIARKIEAEA